MKPHTLYDAGTRKPLPSHIQTLDKAMQISRVPDQNGVSLLYHAWDTPLWSGTLDFLYMRARMKTTRGHHNFSLAGGKPDTQMTSDPEKFPLPVNQSSVR